MGHNGFLHHARPIPRIFGNWPTQTDETGPYERNAMSIETRFCTHCGCPVGLHDDDGCACEDNEGHAATLSYGDTNDVPFCNCERTRPEFNKYSGWSTFSFNMLNGAKAHVELPF